MMSSLTLSRPAVLSQEIDVGSERPVELRRFKRLIPSPHVGFMEFMEEHLIQRFSHRLNYDFHIAFKSPCGTKVEQNVLFEQSLLWLGGSVSRGSSCGDGGRVSSRAVGSTDPNRRLFVCHPKASLLFSFTLLTD